MPPPSVLLKRSRARCKARVRKASLVGGLRDSTHGQLASDPSSTKLLEETESTPTRSTTTSSQRIVGDTSLEAAAPIETEKGTMHTSARPVMKAPALDGRPSNTSQPAIIGPRPLSGESESLANLARSACLRHPPVHDYSEENQPLNRY